MDDLANVILSKLIVYEYLDPFNKIDIEDLKENIHDMWKDYKNVEDIVNVGYNLDYIINDEELLNNILDLIDDNSEDIYDHLDNLDLLDNDYEELLESKIKELNNELNL